MRGYRHNRTTRIGSAIACAVVCCVLMVVHGADARAATPEECARLKSKPAVDAVTGDAGTRDRVQAGLRTAYEDDWVFQEARALVENDSRPADFVSDGEIGKRTRAWLERFCNDFGVDGGPRVVENVIESLVGYARIAERHPDWKATITSAEFKSWVLARDAAKETDFYHLRRSGAAPVVIGLLDEYAARPPSPSPTPAPEPPVEPAESCPPVTATGSGVYYRLSSTDLEILAARKDVLTAVQGLTGQRFESRGALAAAAREAAGASAPGCIRERVAAAVEASAGESATWRVLTKESFDGLIRVSVPRELREALAELQDQLFETDDALREAVRVRVEAVAQREAAAQEQGRAPAQAIREVLEAIKETERAAAAGPGEAPTTGGAREQGASTQGSVARIDVGAVVEKVMALARTDSGFEVRQDPARALRDQPEFIALSEQTLAKLAALEDVAYVNERLVRAAVVAALGRSDRDDAQDAADAVAWQARKQAQHDRAPLAVSGGGCGCLRSFGDKTIYGFYPFWISDLMDSAETSATPQDEAEPVGRASASFEVNFSLLSRIVYYALDLNAEGRIPDRRQWHGSGAQAFITTAHRYGTAADLAVRATGWRDWDDDTLASAVESVVTHLVPQAPRRSMLRPSVRELQDAFLAAKPDGVVLHFPGYPESTPEQRARIVTFVRSLREALRQRDGEGAVSVSLALDLDLLGPDVMRRGVEALQPVLVSAGEGAPELVDDVLVFLEHPSSDSKKQLRLLGESSFEGKERVQLLRKLVPVIAPGGHRGEASDPYRELDDDLRYFEDNFGGAATWPVFEGDAAKDREALEESLRDAFVRTEQLDLLELQVKRFAPTICDLVCPNRVGFRIAMALVLAVALVALLVALSRCGLGHLVAARPWASVAVLVVLVALLLALLACDPVLNRRSTDIMSGLLSVLVLGVLFRFWYRLRQGPLP